MRHKITIINKEGIKLNMIMKHTVRISGMHCTSCALGIEKSVKNLGQGFSAKVNFASETALIEAADMEGINKIISIIKQSGYSVIMSDDAHHGGHEHSSDLSKMKKELIFTAILSIPLAFSMLPLLGIMIPAFLMNHYVHLILATIIIIINKGFYIRGYSAVVKAKSASMDTLVALGTGAAYVYSLISVIFGQTTELYFETAGLLLLFISLGEYLEAVAKKKAGDAIKKLLELSPKEALVIRNNKEIIVKIDELIKGDLIIVKPGQKIPVDGVVIKGVSSVDESMITGESMPVDKTAGSNVIGGTINKSGSFTFKAVKIGSETLLSQIVKMVGEAQLSKAPIERLADKISSIFVPTVIIIAFVSSAIWLIIGQPINFALKIFVTVLVIACPCALGLATPTAIMVGTGKGAQSGILIKEASSLEKVGKAKIVVFDKTGTLTKNKISINSINSYNKATMNEVLSIAASLENKSEHPIAKAIVSEAEKKNISLKEVTNFKNVEGYGITGKIKGKAAFVGKLVLMKNNDINTEILEDDLKDFQSKGHTVVIISYDKKVVGLISLSDEIKEDAAEAVSELKKMNYSVYMITGDNEKSAKSVAEKIGITNMLADVLPGEKAEKIKELQKFGSVVMVGDGVNDAVALTQADIGIAIGSGTDVAIEAGQIVLVKNKVMDVVKALKLSKITLNKIKQNLFWAFFYNVLGIPIAAGILYPLLLNPVIAALAMSLSSVSVVTNSLLINFKKF